MKIYIKALIYHDNVGLTHLVKALPPKLKVESLGFKLLEMKLFDVI